MAKIVITIPDTENERVFKSLGATMGYRAQIKDPTVAGGLRDNPQSVEDFCAQKLSRMVANMVKEQDMRAAITVARDRVLNQAEPTIEAAISLD